MTELELYLQNYFGIQGNNLSLVADLFEEDKIEKGSFYTRKGLNCRKLSFIKSGYLRVFDSTDKKEITQWISFKNYFVTDISSLILGTAARWNIEALTDCELYTISESDYNRITEIVPIWAQLEKQFIAKCFATLEERVFSFLSMTAEERYMALYQFNSELFNQIPLHYLASMLGMTPETLSRIRKNLSS